ncbi:MAG: zinc-binding alcohol dehydrogenase [Conexibacter sp.]|nr:zinc-binding alcohol dehydrogenase [Conexibacter sp.]
MADGTRARALELRAPHDPVVVERPIDPPRAGEFLVETAYSGLSAGTELSFYKGTNPALHAAFDAELGVFVPGAAAAAFPVRRLGYMEVGEVRASRSERVQEGQLVAMAYGHVSLHTADAVRDRFVPLPSGLDPLLGIFVAHMGPICANGLLHAAADATAGADDAQLGDGVRARRVVVTGAGVVGLLTGCFALHHGAAEVAVVDPSPSRLAAAATLGLTPVRAAPDVWRSFKHAWRHGAGDRGADVVFQCRGEAASLATALRCLRPQGTVIDLAFYQHGAEALRLGEEFHHNGLTIRCAQIRRVPRPLAGSWDRDRLSRETIDLLIARGDRIRAALVSDVVALEQAPRLLAQLAARERDALQVVFSFDRAAPDRDAPDRDDRHAGSAAPATSDSTRPYRSR